MHYITTSVNMSQEHSLFFSLSIQSKERGGMAERDLLGKDRGGSVRVRKCVR